MLPYKIAFSFGIVLGLALIIFTLVNRSKLPTWCLVAFGIVGCLSIVSGTLMLVGTIMMNAGA